ncbi:hypothetical protein ABNF97_33420 [Plantactinospora sp. B6F1]|uniref:hypothetical protein n=1 Tax=Plantactinospora sp. B6F1 TaxID=3158971 RepID=UPI0032D8D8BE
MRAIAATNTGRLRWARRALAAVTVVLTGSAMVVLPAGPAAAALPDLSSCVNRVRPSYVDAEPWQARGNYTDAWRAPYGLYHGDVLRIRASGTTRIDYWGATRGVWGDLELAPEGWPMPSGYKYMLVARITEGMIWHDHRNRYFQKNQWFPVGGDSECLGVVLPDPTKRPKLELGINDTNISDNGGGPYVTVQQWW